MFHVEQWEGATRRRNVPRGTMGRRNPKAECSTWNNGQAQSEGEMFHVEQWERGVMGKIVAISNQKGGTGKTTTAVNLSSLLSMFGNKVLIVDIDPQCNASSGLSVMSSQITSYELIIEKVPIREAISGCIVEGLGVVPSSQDLIGVDVELVGIPKREFRLYEGISPVLNEYDVVIIDCPPTLSLLTISALAAADSVLIPVQAEYYALEGLAQLISTIRVVKEKLNPKIDIQGILITMYDARTNLSESVASEIRKTFDEKVYSSVIPRNIKVSESPSYGKPVVLYAPQSQGAKAYYEFALEFSAREGLKNGL